MALPLYLAMTAAEMGGNAPIPDKFAYMACHFSPYGTGLSNIPPRLPPRSMLILNDRIPCRGHDMNLITNQLTELVTLCNCESVLLDFQRPGSQETAKLVRSIVQALPCPVGVSDGYCQDLPCPVFLPPVPADVPISEYTDPWKRREIWLDAALEATEYLLTEDGCRTASLPADSHPESSRRDDALHCHYHMSLAPSQVRFTLCRSRDDLDALLQEAESLGVTRAVGLWQELG